MLRWRDGLGGYKQAGKTPTSRVLCRGFAGERSKRSKPRVEREDCKMNAFALDARLSGVSVEGVLKVRDRCELGISRQIGRKSPAHSGHLLRW